MGNKLRTWDDVVIDEFSVDHIRCSSRLRKTLMVSVSQMCSLSPWLVRTSLRFSPLRFLLFHGLSVKC